MAKFKVGDKVRVIKNNCGGHSVGIEFFVAEKPFSYSEIYKEEICVYASDKIFNLESELELVSEFKNNNEDIKINNDTPVKDMDLLKKFADALMGEPQKSLQKYGVTDDRGNLTLQGSTLYMNWKFKQDLDSFQKDVLDVLIKADKKEKSDK